MTASRTSRLDPDFEPRDLRPVSFNIFPREMIDRDQWVAWQTEDRNGKETKVPFSRQFLTPEATEPAWGMRASSTDPSTWLPFDDVRVFLSDGWHAHYGLGFVFTAKDPYVGIDLDKCRNPETGVIEPWALTIIEAFATYTEPSPSGTGVHIIGRGQIPGDRNRTGQIEMYDRGRFFTMTGNPLDGYGQITDCQDALDTFYARTFPTPVPVASRPQTTLTLDDHELVAKVRGARNGTKYDRLDAGDISEYGNDQSAADLAFVSMLTFYTDDHQQIDRIVRGSGRYREKWDREDYRRRTIEKALQRTTFYDPTPRASAARHGPQTASSAAVGTSQPTNQATDSDGFVGSTDGRHCVVELARIAELEQELARERERRIAAETLNRAIFETMEDPAIAVGEAWTKIRTTFEVASCVSRGEHNAGRVKIRLKNVARLNRRVTDDGQIKETRATSTASRHVHRLCDDGLWDITYERGASKHGPITELFVDVGEILSRLPQPEPAALTVALLRTPAKAPVERPKRGGNQEPQPACNEHPDAGVNISRVTRCAECGDILDEHHLQHAAAPSHFGTENPPPPVDVYLVGQNGMEKHLARRRALRHVRPSQNGTIPISYTERDARIMAIVEAASREQQPLTEVQIALKAGCQPRDVRESLRVLTQRGDLKQWRDGVLTMPSAPASIGAD